MFLKENYDTVLQYCRVYVLAQVVYECLFCSTARAYLWHYPHIVPTEPHRNAVNNQQVGKIIISDALPVNWSLVIKLLHVYGLHSQCLF